MIRCCYHVNIVESITVIKDHKLIFRNLTVPKHYSPLPFFNNIIIKP